MIKQLIWVTVLVLMSGVSLADQADDTEYSFKTKQMGFGFTCAYDVDHKDFMDALLANGYKLVSGGVSVDGTFFNQIAFNPTTRRTLVLNTDVNGAVCMVANFIAAY